MPQDSTTLRELMIDTIKLYSWLDYHYMRGDYSAEFSSYADWLNSLPDDKFLSQYNLVHDRIENLD